MSSKKAIREKRAREILLHFGDEVDPVLFAEFLYRKIKKEGASRSRISDYLKSVYGMRSKFMLSPRCAVIILQQETEEDFVDFLKVLNAMENKAIRARIAFRKVSGVSGNLAIKNFIEHYDGRNIRNVGIPPWCKYFIDSRIEEMHELGTTHEPIFKSYHKDLDYNRQEIQHMRKAANSLGMSVTRFVFDGCVKYNTINTLHRYTLAGSRADGKQQFTANRFGEKSFGDQDHDSSSGGSDIDVGANNDPQGV